MAVSHLQWVWPDPKLCVICGNPLATNHIYVSCGNVFPDKNVPFPWFPQTSKCLNLTFVYLWAWKIMARGILSVCVFLCILHISLYRLRWFGNFIIKSPVTTDPVISVFQMASSVIWCMASYFITEVLVKSSNFISGKVWEYCVSTTATRRDKAIDFNKRVCTLTLYPLVDKCICILNHDYPPVMP